MTAMMGPDEGASDGAWHLDKRVPISIIFALMVNAGTGVWYASKMDNRVSNLELATAKLESAESKTENNSSDNNSRLIRVEDKLDNMAAALVDLKSSLQRITQRP